MAVMKVRDLRKLLAEFDDNCEIWIDARPVPADAYVRSDDVSRRWELCTAENTNAEKPARGPTLKQLAEHWRDHARITPSSTRRACFLAFAGYAEECDQFDALDLLAWLRYSPALQELNARRLDPLAPITREEATQHALDALRIALHWLRAQH